MAFPFTSTINDTASNHTFFFPILTTFILIILCCHGTIAVVVHDNNTTSIGAIIDTNSRIGKEVKTAMKIAVQNFNNNNKSMHHKLSLFFKNPGRNPLQAAYAAEELIKEKEVEAIVGMETWPEATLVADVGNRTQVPIISFAAAAITQPLIMPQQQRRSFLVQMSSNVAEEIKCIAGIVGSFHWRKAIAIYEADSTYGGDLGMLGLLSEALEKVGSEIEYRSVLPPFSSLSDPERFVGEEVAKLSRKQSRVFIVLQSSLSLATCLFREAKQKGIMGKDTVWVITESLSGLLDSVSSTSVIYSMEGALGMKPYFSEESRSFLDFKRQFRRRYSLEHPEEDNSEPGIYALRAYDSITTITKAMMKKRSNTNTSMLLINNVLSSNFTGLSGHISFQGGGVLSPSVFTIINVIGKRYKEIGFWSSKLGFSDSLDFDQEKGDDEKNRNINVQGTMEWLAGRVNWPGDLKRDPKGWAMPSDAKPMKIGIPGRTSFEKFVKVEINSKGMKPYSGFCIDVFDQVLSILNQSYSLPCEFVPYNCTYDELVNLVTNKTVDAVIGDVTILANRSRHVEFTQPFAESSLTMIVPVKTQAHKAWMFLKPFTIEMWVVTLAILVYTMSVVWFLERQSNPDFEGPWKYQLGTALWFTFSSLFFAHKERVHSNYTRVVVVVWLFVVLALSSSYTASLSSMLTVPRLVPNVTDIESLKRNNAPVGCDGDSFIRKYLEDVIGFKSANIKNVSSEYDYPEEFKSGNITVAFLELPYEKAFLNHYCKGYEGTALGGRFGGLGFVFQKGSPIAIDVSEAILVLSENGMLKQLEKKWFTPSSNCLTSQTTTDTDSLSLQSFWGLYLFSATISTICFVLFYIRNLYKHRRHRASVTPNDENNAWHKMVKLAQYFHNGVIKNPWRAQAIVHASDADEGNSSRCDYESSSETLEQLPTSPRAELEMQ